MNDAKTEYILFGTNQQLAKCNNVGLTIGDSTVASSDCVRNLGSYFDKHMSMEVHVRTKCRDAYAQLYNITKIRKYLNFESAERLVNALVHTHLDYCNALLIGLPQKLIRKMQMVQNTAARVLCRVKKFDHITPTLKKLHWLPIAYRIKYKVCLLTFKALRDQGPVYIRDMLSIRSGHYTLRSSQILSLEVPRTKRKTLGDRAFRVAAPKMWNSLPKDLRAVETVSEFKNKLKGHFFDQEYGS